jgi:hypothetical protein
MTDQRRTQLRRTISADREGILEFLGEERNHAENNSQADDAYTRRARDRYKGRRDGLDFAIAAISDLEPEFGGFPVQVRFAHPDAGYPAAQANAKTAGLVEGQVYTIRTMVVGQSSSHLTLMEVPGHYGTEMFEPVWPHENDADEPEYKVAETRAAIESMQEAGQAAGIYEATSGE